MLKKSELFLIPKKTPTKHQLIAASEYGKNPEVISELARKLAFIREEKGPLDARKR